jgi:hypothetical protein
MELKPSLNREKRKEATPFRDTRWASSSISAQDLIEVIDKKLQVDQFTGYVQTGLAYQTNPGAGPGGQTVSG